MSAKRSRGRPILPEGEAKSASVGFRLGGDEIEVIDSAAELAGMKRSDWCRDRLVAIASKEIKRAASKKK